MSGPPAQLKLTRVYCWDEIGPLHNLRLAGRLSQLLLTRFSRLSSPSILVPPVPLKWFWRKGVLVAPHFLILIYSIHFGHEIVRLFDLE